MLFFFGEETTHRFQITDIALCLQCLLGDNYGTVPVPAAIEEEEFRQLRNELCERGEGQSCSSSIASICCRLVVKLIHNESTTDRTNGA